MNRSAGWRVGVSKDTATLVRRSVQAWNLTGGNVDPTVLGRLIRSSYDGVFGELLDDPPVPRSPLIPRCGDISFGERWVCLPPGTAFDPDAVGIALAADIVAAEVVALGAGGVCLTIGGRVVTYGRPAAPLDSPGWTIAVDHPRSGPPIVSVGVTAGAVVTARARTRPSTSPHVPHNMLVDPWRGPSTRTPLAQVTVVAASAWHAETMARDAITRGATHPFDLVDRLGADAIAVTEDGQVLCTDGFERLTGGAPVPARVAPIVEESSTPRRPESLTSLTSPTSPTSTHSISTRTVTK